jgi:small conductance mechanosensitive channel
MYEDRSLTPHAAQVKRRLRLLLVALAALLVTGILALYGYVLARGVDARSETLALVRSVTPGLLLALGKLALAAIAVVAVRQLIRRLLLRIEARLEATSALTDRGKSVSTLFTGLDRTMVAAGWLLLAVYAASLLPFPPGVLRLLLLIVRVYLVVALGLLIIRAASLIVHTVDAIAGRAAEARGWDRFYDPLRSLLPTLRACLEYALWIAVATLVIIQFRSLQSLAAWGPRLIEAIAIFFAGRVLIELGHLEIERRMLPREGLDDTDRRRRETMLPLVSSAFSYAAYFGTAVFVLSALGFNPMPFLAGAGILGLVIGFGAQSLINDVVSGFFILFEEIYFVGDMVEVGSAKGIVEAIEFRTTKIRDADGRVHIIRNGDMKPVINYSRGYSMAVVAIDVGYDVHLPEVFSALQRAGERLRGEHRDVLGETQIDGIVAFGPSTMTVRTSTRARPGRHEAVAAALRLLINESFERHSRGAQRKTLVGESPVGRGR